MSFVWIIYIVTHMTHEECRKVHNAKYFLIHNIQADLCSFSMNVYNPSEDILNPLIKLRLITPQKQNIL